MTNSFASRNDWSFSHSITFLELSEDIPSISKKCQDSELIKEESVVRESIWMDKFGFSMEDSDLGNFSNLSAILRFSMAFIL